MKKYTSLRPCNRRYALEERVLPLLTAHVNNMTQRWGERSQQGRRCFPPQTGCSLMQPSQKNHLRGKRRQRNQSPALPPPQVISQSVNPPPTWQPTYPAPHGATNMLQPRIQSFLHLPLILDQLFLSRLFLNSLSVNHQCLVLAYSPRGILACRQLSTSWSSRLQQWENAMGVGTTWVNKYKTPPCNIIIKHVDRRVTGKDSTTGQLIRSQDYSNTYYHPIAAHVTKKIHFFPA